MKSLGNSQPIPLCKQTPLYLDEVVSTFSIKYLLSMKRFPYDNAIAKAIF
ncbi:hypothetical protein [Pectinatus sottacetonis]|nr:hypothetical protein [Pectinatus sottacetonis]